MDNYLTHIEKHILTITAFSITFLTALSAINRYSLKLCLPWIQEITIIFYMLLVFYGVSNIAKNSDHLRVSVLEFVFKNDNFHFYHNIIINGITLCVTIMGVFYGLRMVITTTRTTTYLSIPYNIILFLSFVMGFMFYSIRVLCRLLIPSFLDRKKKVGKEK